MPPSRRRAIVVASAAVIGLVQLVGTFGAAEGQPDARDLDALAFALLAASALALGVRDRWPIPSVAVVLGVLDLWIGLGYPYGPIFLSAAVALFDVVVFRRTATLCPVVGVAAVGLVGFAVATVLRPDHDGSPWAGVLGVTGWMLVAIAVGEVVRSRRDHARAQAARRAETARREADEQRLGLAQELHDVLAHNISLINVQASVALHLLDDQPDAARPALGHIKDASHEALNGLRAALDVLRRGDDAPRTPAPRLTDLPTLVANVRAGGLAVDLRLDLPDEPLPAAVELAGYRIVQEALTNVTRHAQADRVEVRVDAAAVGQHGVVTLEVVDDGIGGVPVAGNGLTGMRERAASVGGTVEVGPAHGGGLRVAAQLPVDEP